ncbi:MAG: transglycosylase SLT domain-containing protein, partial [Candidatus Nomurabacteria bacterium]
LVLLFLAINPDIVTGNVDLSSIVVSGSMRSGAQTATQTGSTGSSSCPDETAFKNNVISNGNVCLTNTCEALTGCDTTTYSSIINSEATKQGINPKLVTILMCRESKGKVNATHVNDSNSIDCGLMQINKTGASSCLPADLDPQTNIAKGVALIKANYSSITQGYPGITKEMMVSAAYNCCSTGNPNTQSSDCTPSAGYPFTLPKWACPIRPGPTNTNMCFVRNYVCDVNACLSKL